MKQIALFLTLTIGILMLSCEDFRDNNGDLGGEWQLQEWRTRSTSGEIDSLVANNVTGDSTLKNQRRLYYSIHRDVFQIRDAATFNNMRYFCSYEKTADSLILKDVVDSNGDLFISSAENDYDRLKTFGVPQDGRFQYQIVDHNRLLLRYKDNILSFRRY